MRKKENRNSENIVAGLSAAAGSVVGAVGANAVINQIEDSAESAERDVVVQHVENPDDVVVVSPSVDIIQEDILEQPDREHVLEPDPIPIVVYPEPDPIIECVYAGPEPIDPYIDPYIDPAPEYGPPIPDPFPDIDTYDPADDFFADDLQY